MPHTELHETARALVAEGKGILAADESDGTIKKRFDTIGVESTEESRRGYRNLLFTTPGAEEYISGVILFDETIRQKADDGTPFPELLASKGVIPGIKVDRGTTPLAVPPVAAGPSPPAALLAPAGGPGSRPRGLAPGSSPYGLLGRVPRHDGSDIGASDVSRCALVTGT